MIIISTGFDGNAYNTQRTNIDGLTVSFRFLWNEREGAWYCDFESVNGANYGVRLQAGRCILGASNRTTDGGDFVILKTENGSSDALGFYNLGSTYKLCFLTAADIEIFRAYGVL